MIKANLLLPICLLLFACGAWYALFLYWRSLRNTFIVTQQALISRDINGNSIHNNWAVITRQVTAKNKEQAIGKFILQTDYIIAIQKLNIECNSLTELKCIK